MDYVKGKPPVRGPGLNSIYALDRTTGMELWAYHPEGEAMPTPVDIEGFLYVGTGVVYEGSPVSGDFYAFDLKTGKQSWVLHLGSQIRSGAAILNGAAYLPDHSGDVAAIRISDGKLLGEKHLGCSFGPSSPVIVGGTLYVSNVFGWVNAIRLTEIK
jgi:outer membrane protein assembly factor BamB